MNESAFLNESSESVIHDYLFINTVVDGKGLFWNVFAGLLSALWELAERGKLISQQFRNVSGQEVGHYNIGDAAYSLTSWLMKPFSDNGVLTQQQEVFNHRTSKARVVVKNAFWPTERKVEMFAETQ